MRALRPNYRYRHGLSVALVLTLGLMAGKPARADLVNDGRAIVSSMVSTVIEILRDRSADRRAREQLFTGIYRQHFDGPVIARWVMGRAWRLASAPERAEFQQLFETYVVKTYVIQFSGFSGEVFKVLGAEPDGPGVVVSSHVLSTNPADAPIKIRWRLRKKSGALKIRDVVIENISMSLNQRREFAAAFQRNGGTAVGLITALKQKISGLDKK